MFKKKVPNQFELALAVTDHTNAMLAYWDSNLICRFANSAYLNWFGFEPQDIINKMHIKQLLGPLFEKNLTFINNALEGKVQVFERDITTPSGETRNTIATYTPDIEKGKVKGFYAHVADITLLKKNATSNGLLNQTASGINLYGTEAILQAVENTLRAFIFLGFPGIPTLAKQHLVSESKLKRDFKTKYHKPIFDYFRQLQMEVAEKHIRENGCSKKQMAATLKFSNPSNFLVCYQKYLNDKSAKQLVDDLIRTNDDQYKIFISQSPVALAMFDAKLNLMTASLKWITFFQLPKGEINGESFYDILPGEPTKWKSLIRKSLKGAVSSGEGLFKRKDGSKVWLRWNIQRWLNAKQETGGLIVFTEDITALKQSDNEKKRILDLLIKTSEMAGVGAWKRNLTEGTVIWSKVTKEILELPEDYQPGPHPELHFYKTTEDQQTVAQLIKIAIEYHQSFDFNAEIITAKGNKKNVRVFGFPEIVNGKCEKLYGILQEIKPQFS